jgi:hypothetical protein
LPQGQPISRTGKGLKLFPSKVTSQPTRQGDHHANHHHKDGTEIYYKIGDSRSSSHGWPPDADAFEDQMFPRLAWLSLHRAIAVVMVAQASQERQRHGQLCRRLVELVTKLDLKDDPCRPLDRRREVARSSRHGTKRPPRRHQRRASADAEDEGQRLAR